MEQFKKNIIMCNRKNIGHGLLESWQKNKELDSNTTKLEYYLRFNYDERYVQLCYRLNIKPLSFGKWLLKPIDSLI